MKNIFSPSLAHMDESSNITEMLQKYFDFLNKRINMPIALGSASKNLQRPIFGKGEMWWIILNSHCKMAHQVNQAEVRFLEVFFDSRNTIIKQMGSLQKIGSLWWDALNRRIEAANNAGMIELFGLGGRGYSTKRNFVFANFTQIDLNLLKSTYGIKVRANQ